MAQNDDKRRKEERPPPPPREPKKVPPEEEQIGNLPGELPTSDPRDPRFPGSQPDLA